MDCSKVLPCLVLVSVCVSVTSSFEQPSWRNMEKLRRSNCTKCEESLQRNVQEVLPRLSLIKQRILNAIGRNPDQSNDWSNEIGSFETRNAPDVTERLVTPKPVEPVGYRLNEIISYSRPSYDYHGETVLEFSCQGNKGFVKEEAVGASLLLYVDRRRKIRKGGKGKKIVLEVSKLNKNNGTWESLALLRTRVKKRRWKRISLPVKAAQQFLDADDRLLDLKISCVGCGRLVDIVLNKYSNKNFNTSSDDNTNSDKQNRSSKTHRKYRRRSKRREKLLKRRQKHSGTPILVISTRVEVR